MLKVNDYPQFIRDPFTSAILNTDVKAKEMAKKQRSLVDRVENLETQIESVSEKLDRILMIINSNNKE